eukprot:SAG31_NODE_183_length_20987_cov_8.711078_9_plen_102_part_00
MNLAHLELLLPGCADYVDISMLELHNGGLVPEVSTGLPYLLVPVKGPCGLAKAKMASIDGESGLLAVGKHSRFYSIAMILILMIDILILWRYMLIHASAAL